jgi:hypothetical protein
MTRAGLVPVVLVLALFAVVGCRSMEPPAGYVSLPPDYGQEFSAVSPTGNRIVVREHENPDEGTLEFWRDAVKAELVEGKGYDVVSSQGVAGSNGEPVWEFLFEVRRTEGEYLYLVLIRVDGDDVIVTEAGGRAEPMEEDLETLRANLR